MKIGVMTAKRSWRKRASRTETVRNLLRSTMTPLLLASLLSGSFACPAFSQPPTSSASRSHLKGNVSFNKISAPEAGVALLERIFNRVMSIPQIAIAKPSPKQALVDQQKENGVDYALAIRPKETGKIFNQQATPSLRVLPPTTRTDTLAAKNVGNEGESAPEPPPYYGAPSSSGGGLAGATAGTAFAEEDSNIESWKGGNLMRGSGKARDSATLAKADADRLGIWDKDMSPNEWSADKNSRSTSLPPTNMGKFVHQPGDSFYQTPSTKASQPLGASSALSTRARQQNQLAQQPPDLQSAIGRLYGAAKRMEEAQRMMDAPAEKKSATPQSNVTTVSGGDLKQKAKSYGSPRQFQIVDERPVVHDFRQAAESITTKLKDIQIAQAQNKPSYYAPPPAPMSRRSAPSQSQSGGYSNGAGAFTQSGAPVSGYKLPSNAIPAQILSIEDASNTLRKQQGATSPSRANAIASQLYNQMMLDKGSVEKRETIALLPPNVATGIPLVSLGTSQMQVASALSNMGQLKEQKINRWSVMTWKKPETGTTALQLFFRNGLLDAIRIFDPTLVAPDFGVAPGDSLERVKEKFGEPAFLLQEPTSGMGQNYIYPISQVGFQLARGSGNTPPKVVSILIFSVK